MKTYIAKLYKGGHIIKIDVQAKSQREAKQVAENICKTAYPDYKYMVYPKRSGNYMEEDPKKLYARLYKEHKEIYDKLAKS